MDTQEDIYSLVTDWLEKVVIDLNLCPFAKAPYKKGLVKISISHSKELEDVFVSFMREVSVLDSMSADELETTVFVIPNIFDDFNDYLDALALVNQLLVDQGYEGVYQIASFHPDYQFEGAQRKDRENYTNRAPFPMFHIIREASVEKVLVNYPDPDDIPQRNIALMEAMSEEQMRQLFYWQYRN